MEYGSFAPLKTLVAARSTRALGSDIRVSPVFTRPWALKLLAPTILVSLAFVGACIFSTMWLNYLHGNIARDFSENRESHEAATKLETTTRELLALLRGDHQDTEAAVLAEQLQTKTREATQWLATAQDHANLEEEKVYVGKVADGLKKYLEAFSGRAHQSSRSTPVYDKHLAEVLQHEVLDPCIALRDYNLDQEEESDHQNRLIVITLKWVLLVVGLGAPLGGLLLGYVVARSLRHSIYQLSVGIRDAAGRLNRELGSVTLEEEGDLPGLHRQLQGVLAEIERVIEQLQQREREVLRAEQLAAVGQVAAGVAHELRNPLTSIKMLVQTALENHFGDGPPREDLDLMEHEIRRMEQCIQMFLDFARPPRCERRRTDLVPVVRRALALVEGRARRQKVTIQADLPQQPIYVMIDPEQIHQVVLNLLLNSLDALPRGGTARLELLVGKEIEVRVSDSGPGILPRIRNRLFEPFISSKETGMGLGLSICKRLIEAHGGAICGDNSPGGGAVFSFTLPG
ncbi:MAG TPA: ATP-binding protein [Gemmataceae bacterium]|nr:ATP-binding protein [Gemmataceae bacterium]